MILGTYAIHAGSSALDEEAIPYDQRGLERLAAIAEAEQCGRSELVSYDDHISPANVVAEALFLACVHKTLRITRFRNLGPFGDETYADIRSLMVAKYTNFVLQHRVALREKN
jgi:hypothetical protein